MIRENNVFTFTDRLNYSVNEISEQEFLMFLANFGRTKNDKELADNIRNRLNQFIM